MNYAKSMDGIYSQHQRLNKEAKKPQETRITPAGKLFRKQFGRRNLTLADKISRKHPYLTALPGILYFLISK